MNNVYLHFKETLKCRRDIVVLPKYLLVGERKWNVIQTRLRCFSSDLKSDLYRVNLTASPYCECGHMNEDAYHFLFECTMYVNHRVILFNTVTKFP